MIGNAVYCALDTSDYDHARAIGLATRGAVAGIKLGLEFFAANGPDGVARLAAATGARLFLDLKLHDIPSTVGKAVAALAGCPYAILTVHASGGTDMMRAARAAAAPGARVVGVTVLTSMDAADLAGVGVADVPAGQVRRLGELARRAGLDGLVCSPHEVAAMRAAWPDGLLVVPGIRPEGSDSGDQKRVMTPRQARDAGADILVIGRPITAAPDPAAAARAIADSL